MSHVLTYHVRIGIVLSQQHVGDEDKRQRVNLPNWVIQKPRAFHIAVVAELLLDVHTRLTPPTRAFNQFFYQRRIMIYYTTIFP
jgi:hypothetical protein